MLEPGGPDFTIVAVPTELHLAVAQALASAGPAILIEKPVASSSEAAREIVELCARAGVPRAVGHVERFNPGCRRCGGGCSPVRSGVCSPRRRSQRPVSVARPGCGRGQGPGHPRRRGVSEGDVTRYALRREEPLRIEHETFLDLLDGETDAEV